MNSKNLTLENIISQMMAKYKVTYWNNISWNMIPQKMTWFDEKIIPWKKVILFFLDFSSLEIWPYKSDHKNIVTWLKTLFIWSYEVCPRALELQFWNLVKFFSALGSLSLWKMCLDYKNDDFSGENIKKTFSSNIDGKWFIPWVRLLRRHYCPMSKEWGYLGVTAW